MRIVIAHEGFVRGQPPRYRHVGEMRVLMETAVELDSISSTDAPLAYLYQNHNDGTVREYRWHDGAFLAHLPHGGGLMEKAAKGAISLRSQGLDADYFFDEYREICRWRDYASRGIGSRGDLAPARRLEDWNAQHVDDSDAHVFEQAVRDVMKTLVVVDGNLWTRCFEPCLAVSWRTYSSGSVELEAGPYDTRNLHGRLGRETTDAFGLKIIKPTSYSTVGSSTPHHERCFAASEVGRMTEFVKGLTAGPAAQGLRIRLDLQPEHSLRVVDPALCSTSFDELELGRSARTYTAAWDTMQEKLKSATGGRWKKVLNFGEFDTRAAEVDFSLRDFENGKGSPEEVMEAMGSLRQGLDHVVSASLRKLNVDLSLLLPPEYFGDPDNMDIDVDLAPSRAHAGH